MKRQWVLFLFFMLSAGLGFSKTDTLEIKNSKTSKIHKAVIVTPESYESSGKRYSTVYLLHGGVGKFSDWTKQITDKALIQKLADQYDFIIVMPEGEQFSYYLDSPVNAESQFESYIAKDVVEYIDANFRTIAQKKGRAITGLSMGGFGSLYLAAQHPDLFIAVGSMSGAINPDMKGWKLPADAMQNIGNAFAGILGKKDEFPERYEQVSIINKIGIYQSHGIRLIIDCGVDDFLIEPNRELHRRMVFEKISHEYTERDGGHSWPYWENALPHHLLFFSKVLE